MKRAVLLLGSILLLCATAFCQDTASMVGTVTDSSGAVIPNAKVTVSNPDKGYTRELVSNSAGAYSISAAPIGNYVVTAEAAGFEKLVRSGITLQVGQVQRVDLQLTVGQVTQEVSVTGNVVQVQTETAALSDVVTSSQISKLELNGRNWVSLALLVPGAAPSNGLDTQHVGVAGNNNISFNGSRTQYNNWEIDGGNNTDEGSAGTFNTYPNLDTIAEFRISTSNYGADLGKHAGATIELATKSGTKDFHGNLSEYNRNSDYAAADFFTNRSNQKIGFLNQNEYGYTLGGPVWIPGHYNTDKSKTFFYWSEDWRSIRQGQTLGGNVATPLMRQGDFSQCDSKSPNYNSVAASGCTLPSLGGQTFDNIAQVDAYLESPAGGSVPAATLTQALTNGTDLINAYMPLPNVQSPVGWFTASSSATNWRQEQIRVDQNISDKTQVFMRYTQDAWNTVSVPALWNWASYDTIKTPFKGPGKSAVLHITHSFSPSLMNEFIAAYTVDHIALQNQAADSVAGSINRPSSFVQNHMFAQNDSNPLLPTAGTCIGDPFCWYEDAGNRPWFNSNPIITWKDNVSWIHGNHTTKMGVYLENYRKSEQFGTNTQGIDYFGGGSLTTGNGLIDMYAGRFQYYTEGTQAVAGVPVGGYPKGHWQMTDLEPFIQDDWKVNKNLTLNLGLRWYDYTRIHDVSRPTIDSGFIPAQYSLANAALIDNNGNIVQGTGSFWNNYGNGLVECGHGGIAPGCNKNNTLLNFAPRFGFAWDPWGTGKTVIRGGYGIYFESGNGNEAEAEGGEGNPPAELGLTAYNVNGYSSIAPGNFPTAGYTNWPYSQNWPYEQQYSLGIQRQITTNDLITVSYVGNLGIDLARAVATNQVPDGLTTVHEPAVTGLVNISKTDKSGLGLSPSCDASGNCNVQALLINQYYANIYFVPYRTYSGITTKENTGHSTYNALQFNYRHAFSHGLTFQTAYTWSHAIDNSTSTYEQNFQIDDTNLSRWKATSDNNRAQVLVLNYVYDLPFLKNSSNHLAKSILGGWSVSGISTFFTGTPIDFECAPPSGINTGIGGTAKCNPVGAMKIKKGTFNDPSYGPTPTWYDSSVENLLTAPQLLANGEAGMFGYEGRNQLTGPGRNSTDLAFIKDFELPWFKGEHSTLEARGEMFNAFNHVSWQGVNTGCANNNNVDGTLAFGRTCGFFTQTAAGGAVSRYNSGTGEVNSDWGPRVIQFGLKFVF
ncbi:MAG TPA: carboxypeptidase-like regulatory domain-containing protein [Terriglobia bacterium]|nr:carboxypeptidase-like regulatory domain-containing protein [Terriglobia bacterium]